MINVAIAFATRYFFYFKKQQVIILHTSNLTLRMPLAYKELRFGVHNE